ncbi:hypothetical protein [Paenibacillus yonginensis]|uniref:hypothetical protein n=1 Tax=Paenibacillus yonginensis TaxID=1462996 RepID=UPI0012488732|nr:hypothetical protein [Paenibacillus yonginensis]
MKVRKILPAVALACSVLAPSVLSTSTPLVASAATSESTASEVQKVKLYDLYVNVPYSEDQYSFVRSETSEEVRVEIIDKSTGKKVDAYGETIPSVKLNSKVQPQASSDGYYSNRNVYRDVKVDDFATVRINLNLYMYTLPGSSFMQINEINGVDIVAASTGYYDVVSPNVYAKSSTGSLPTTSVSVSGSGVIDTTYSQSGGVNIEIFGYTLGSNHHYRKPFSVSWTYSLY